jgi:hypothetical protein
MLFTNVLASLTGLAAVAAAAPTLVERQIPNNDVVPWNITYAVSGRPAPRYPDADRSISIEFANPNDYKLQRVPGGYTSLPHYNATCTWTWKNDDVPFGTEAACVYKSATSKIWGNLTMTLQPGTDDPAIAKQANFSVDIKETRANTIFGLEYIRVWEGKAAFGSSNLKLICGNQGQCAWGLTERPLLVKQELTKSVGSCEQSTIGGC